MTEEDTFKILRRIPIEEMSDKLRARWMISLGGTEFNEARIKLLEENGWTLNDYNDILWKHDAYYGSTYRR